MEHWGRCLEESLVAAEMRNDEQSCRMQELEAENLGLQERAKCAPPFFENVAEFLRVRCIDGESERVGTSELHAALAVFMKHHHRGTLPPSQRDLRALLEQLGFEYNQVYIAGCNTRGFRGLGLRPETGG